MTLFLFSKAMDPASSGQDGDSLRGLERKGADGNLALVADDKPPREISPGRKPFKDLVPSEPKSTIVEGVKWCENPDKKVPGQLIFPSSFSGEIATDLATLDNVRYYGARFANRTDGEVEVSTPHQQTGFTYADNYLQNSVMASKKGATLERHRFCHTDTPSTDEDGDQGIFVMGKFLDEKKTQIELTGFVIPRGETLWVPGCTIHTNNYLKGRWTTMLSTKEEIDEVKMIKDGNNFHFSFKWVLVFHL